MSKVAVVLDDRDNVATALRDIQAGEVLDLGTQTVHAVNAIQLCHKIALVDLAIGEPVLKYGAVIGETSMPVKAGAHVHTHNLKSRRAR